MLGNVGITSHLLTPIIPYNTGQCLTETFEEHESAIGLKTTGMSTYSGWFLDVAWVHGFLLHALAHGSLTIEVWDSIRRFVCGMAWLFGVFLFDSLDNDQAS